MPTNAGNTSIILQDANNIQTDFSRNALWIGIKQTIGTAGNAELKDKIGSKLDVNTYFGRNSHIAQGLNYAFDYMKNRQFGEDSLFISGIALNPLGVKSAGNILFAGTSTETKTVSFTLGREDKKKTLNVASGTTATNLVIALNTLLGSDLDLPITSAINVTPEQIDLTATVEGTWANYMTILIENLPAGITATVTQLTNGTYAGITDLTAIKTAIDNNKYDLIVVEKDLLALDVTVQDFFDERFNQIVNKDKQGQVITYSVNSTEASIVNNYEESKWGIDLAMHSIYTLPYVVISEISTLKESRLVENINISDKFNTSDGLGAIRHVGIPMNEIKLSTVKTLPSQYTDQELKNLKEKGFLTIENDINNNFVILTGNQSTYVKDLDGNVPDLNRVNDIEREMIVSKELFNTVSLYKGKILKTGGAVTEHDLVPEQIKSDLHGMIENLSGTKTIVQPSGLTQDVLYGILNNAPAVIQKAKANINAMVDKLVSQTDGRTINGVVLTTLARNIENIIFTQLFS